jgi:hypothetical protein
VVRVELALDVRAVRLDRAHAQEQLLADLGVGVPQGEKSQNVDLPRAEVVPRRAGVAGLRGDAGAEPRAQVGVTRGGGPDGGHELGTGRLLEDVATRAGPERLAGERRVVLHGEDHDGARVLDPGDSGQARRPGHAEVEHEHVRATSLDQPQRPGDIARLAHDVHALLGLQQEPQPGADDLVVVGQHDADGPRGVVAARHACDHSHLISGERRAPGAT